MKKMALLIVMVCVLGGLMATQSWAVQGWYLCNVNQAGTANVGLISFNITETSGAFGGPIYVYQATTDPDANRNLASALTAVSNGKTAWVFTDPFTGGTLGKILVNSQ